MSNRLIHTQFGELADRDVDSFSKLNVDTESLTEYVMLQMNVCRSYRVVDQNTQEAFQTYSRQLHSQNTSAVWAAAVGGDAGACLELGLRYYAGCGAKKDISSAIDMWRRISDPLHPQFFSPDRIPRKIRARALSCLANAHWDKRIVDDGEAWNIDTVFRAASCADACASYGLVTPTVLLIGQMVQRILAEDIAPGWDHSRFLDLEFLNEALDIREREVQAEQSRREKKITKEPTAYVCAAPGCGIGATRKATLLKCGGKCPPDIKPHYCSKECQKADWRRHRPECKPNAPPPPKAEVTSSLAPKTSPGSEETIGDTLRDSDGKQRTIEIVTSGMPGGKVTLASTTMTPTFMKEFRDEVERLEATSTGKKK